MASFGGDQVLLFGGQGSGGYAGDTWAYDLSLNIWVAKAPVGALSARSSHAVTYLGEDQVLLFWGYGSAYCKEAWPATGFYSGTSYRIYLPLVMRSW